MNTFLKNRFLTALQNFPHIFWPKFLLLCTILSGNHYFINKLFWNFLKLLRIVWSEGYRAGSCYKSFVRAESCYRTFEQNLQLLKIIWSETVCRCSRSFDQSVAVLDHLIRAVNCYRSFDSNACSSYKSFD